MKVEKEREFLFWSFRTEFEMWTIKDAKEPVRGVEAPGTACKSYFYFWNLVIVTFSTVSISEVFCVWLCFHFSSLQPNGRSGKGADYTSSRKGYFQLRLIIKNFFSFHIAHGFLGMIDQSLVSTQLNRLISVMVFF